MFEDGDRGDLGNGKAYTVIPPWKLVNMTRAERDAAKAEAGARDAEYRVKVLGDLGVEVDTHEMQHALALSKGIIYVPRMRFEEQADETHVLILDYVATECRIARGPLEGLASLAHGLVTHFTIVGCDGGCAGCDGTEFLAGSFIVPVDDEAFDDELRKFLDAQEPADVCAEPADVDSPLGENDIEGGAE